MNELMPVTEVIRRALDAATVAETKAQDSADWAGVALAYGAAGQLMAEYGLGGPDVAKDQGMIRSDDGTTTTMGVVEDAEMPTQVIRMDDGGPRPPRWSEHLPMLQTRPDAKTGDLMRAIVARALIKGELADGLFITAEDFELYRKRQMIVDTGSTPGKYKITLA